VHPRTGFQVASVHSIFECSAIEDAFVRPRDLAELNGYFGLYRREHLLADDPTLQRFFGETDVFGAEAYADEAGGDAAEIGETFEQFEEPREG